MKQCNRCGQTKPVTEFNKKTRSYGKNLQPYCKPCQSEYQREFYAANPMRNYDTIYSGRKRRRKVLLDFLFEFFLENPCVDCGETDLLVLELDHVEDSKEFGIAKALSNTMSLTRVQREIGKCEVRCANCHRRRTAEQQHSWRWHLKHGDCPEGTHNAHL